MINFCYAFETAFFFFNLDNDVLKLSYFPVHSRQIQCRVGEVEISRTLKFSRTF